MSELIDNRAHRIRTLKDVIRHLHQGRAPGEVKAQLSALVRECDASEIAAMEQELMAEGVPASEIMGMCDLHSQVVRDILVEKASAPPPPGNVDYFLLRMIDGEPGFLLSPNCKILRKGFRGGYQFERVQVSGDARYKGSTEEEPLQPPA